MEGQSLSIYRVWSARCECYKMHNSASGRCNARDVTDHEAKGKPIVCERCKRECRKGTK